MKKISAIAAIFLLLLSPTHVQAKKFKELTVAMPAESMAKFIQPLLPYRIDMGENFSGSFWVKSIENIKITQNRVSFSAHISGKNIGYSAKVGKQTANFEVGDVNLRNHWEASLRYDKSKKKAVYQTSDRKPAEQEGF